MTGKETASFKKKIIIRPQHDTTYTYMLDDSEQVNDPFYPFLNFFWGATCMAYGGSQARGLNGATAAGLRHNHSNVRSATYTIAHSNPGSLIH